MEVELTAILNELKEIRRLLEGNPRAGGLNSRGGVGTPPQQRGGSILPRLPDLDPEIAADIENHIVPEWWYEKYGEDPHPAKYMDTEGFGFSPEELAFLQGCMRNLTQRPPLVNGGTHRFEFVGRRYCKAERNTVSCYACVPIKSQV